MKIVSMEVPHVMTYYTINCILFFHQASTVRFNTDDPEAVVFHSATYLNELRTVHGVIGPGDPDVTKLIAPLASSQSNTIQVRM